jgi:hypothetical protein
MFAIFKAVASTMHYRKFNISRLNIFLFLPTCSSCKNRLYSRLAHENWRWQVSLIVVFKFIIQYLLSKSIPQLFRYWIPGATWVEMTEVERNYYSKHFNLTRFFFKLFNFYSKLRATNQSMHYCIDALQTKRLSSAIFMSMFLYAFPLNQKQYYLDNNKKYDSNG